MAFRYQSAVLRGVIMNPNHNQTITVFNCLKGADSSDGKKDVWQRTVLRDCYYKSVINRVEEGKSVRMVNTYIVRIPESGKYRPYSEWSSLSRPVRQGYFTLHTDDIIVKGECSETLTGTSPNTASEFLKRKKPNAFVITAISDNTQSRHAKHYRAGG